MNAQLAAILVLLFLSSLFSATETAYTSLSFLQLKALEGRKGRSSRIAFGLLKDRDRLLTTVLVGNNIVNLSASALTTTYAIDLFGNTAVGLATGVLTLVILVFGEITPKQLALAHSMKIAIFMAWPIRIFSAILFPLVWLLRLFSGAITRLFSSQAEPDVTHEGMRLMVDVAEDVGLVDQYESDLIERAIHFSKTQVRTIMTHRTNVFRLSDERLLSECYEAIVKSGYSRIPVYHENEENISGILLMRDVLRAQLKGKMERPLSSLVRRPVFIPEQMHLDDVFYRFKKDKLQQAIVLDEYGGFSGVVTMEDVAEQLFGELFDEHEARHIDRIVERDDEPGVFLVMADTPLQQLVDDLDLDGDHHKNSTVAAYLLEQSGAIPQEGDALSTPLGTFRVISMTGNRMEAVEFHRRQEGGP
ncbi:MAG: hemolysin family protein [Sphaerochaeta sp.]|jgi:CBS domain containing-hemolysin-like protein|nr:hemolysin family protein [Sphaerochaeta sp.]MDX9916324.1 hemolysin family protein [Sphaerochaeta sp.]